MSLEGLKKRYKHYTKTGQLDKAAVMADKAQTGYNEDITVVEEEIKETKSKKKG